MRGIEIVPFEREHVTAAAALLAARHAAHRAAEPTLPPVVDLEAQVERDLDARDASGAVALAGSEVVGYLLGHRRDDAIGRSTWVDLASHAVRDPELVRDLYAVAAARWVEEGSTRHFAFVPAARELLEPWYRLGFGISAALAARETAPVDLPGGRAVVRPGTVADLEASAALDRLLWEHLSAAPSFGGLPIPDPPEFVDDWRDTWEDDRYAHFVAELDGRVVGQALLYRRPAGDLRVPEGSIDLANAATLPERRGEGVGLALAAHALRWAHAQGIETMITDWRMTNLLASRFWPRRGFRETFQRVYRSIP